MDTDVRVSEVSAIPIGDVTTRRGKELAADDTVADARRLFGNESVRVLPVLDGSRYVGAVDRDSIAGEDPSTNLGSAASALLPTTAAAVPAADAVALLPAGASRLVVLADDGVTYVGLVCLRSDGERLCIDAECHPPPTT